MIGEPVRARLPQGGRIDDDEVSIWQIFQSSMPYWVIVLPGVALIAIFPQIATWLPSLVF